MKLKTRSFLIFFFTLSLFSLKIEAQVVRFEECRDINGHPVASVSNPSIPDIAMAAIVSGYPVILHNPSFFCVHECHALQALRLGQEQQADYRGISTPVCNSYLNDRDIWSIQNDIARFGSGDWTYLPGPQRAINLAGCLNDHSFWRSTKPVYSAANGDFKFCESIRFLLKASENEFASIKRNLTRHSDGTEEWKPSIMVAGSQGCDGQSDREISPSISCDMATAQSADALEAQYQKILTELPSCLDKTFVFSEKHGGKSTRLGTPIKEATFERKAQGSASDGPAVRVSLSQYHSSRTSHYELTVWIDGKDPE